MKSPVGLCCDIAVLLHRVVKEYTALLSQPGWLYRNNSYTHAPAYSFGSWHSGRITVKALFKTSAISETKLSATSAVGLSPRPNHCEGNSQSITLAVGGNRKYRLVYHFYITLYYSQVTKKNIKKACMQITCKLHYLRISPSERCKTAPTIATACPN